MQSPKGSKTEQKSKAPAPTLEPIIKVLSGIKLLEGIDREGLKDIAINCRYKRFPANQQIFDKNSRASDVFFVVRGHVRIVNYSLSGREITIDNIVNGGHFGELTAIDGKPSIANVMTLTESLIVALPRQHFLKAIAKYPAMAVNIMKYLANLVRSSTERIMDLSTLGSNHRVLADLLLQAKASPNKRNEAMINPVPVHGDIASRASTTRETVARVLNELARNGIVERKKDFLIIRDVESLRKMVENARGE